MNKTQKMLQQYNEEEIKQLLKDKVRLVYIDNGKDELIARYEDLPDIIVDINEKFGHTADLNVYDYADPIPLLLSTTGYFLNKCDSNVRKDIIDRLVGLQQGELEIKDYKIIDEDRLCNVITVMEEEEMEK